MVNKNQILPGLFIITTLISSTNGLICYDCVDCTEKDANSTRKCIGRCYVSRFYVNLEEIRKKSIIRGCFLFMDSEKASCKKTMDPDLIIDRMMVQNCAECDQNFCNGHWDKFKGGRVVGVVALVVWIWIYC